MFCKDLLGGLPGGFTCGFVLLLKEHFSDVSVDCFEGVWARDPPDVMRMDRT